MAAQKRKLPLKKRKAKRKPKKKKSKNGKLKGGNMFAAAGAELLANKGGDVVDGLLSSSGLVNPNAAFNNEPDKKIETIDMDPMNVLFNLVSMNRSRRWGSRY